MFTVVKNLNQINTLTNRHKDDVTIRRLPSKPNSKRSSNTFQQYDNKELHQANYK